MKLLITKKSDGSIQSDMLVSEDYVGPEIMTLLRLPNTEAVTISSKDGKFYRYEF